MSTYLTAVYKEAQGIACAISHCRASAGYTYHSAVGNKRLSVCFGHGVWLKGTRGGIWERKPQ